MYFYVVSGFPLYSVINCVLNPRMYIQIALIGIGICTFVIFKQLFQMRGEVTNWGKPIRSGHLTHFLFLVSFDEVLSDLIYINSQWDSVVVIFCCECFSNFSAF